MKLYKCMFKKEDKKDREVQGSAALRNGAYDDNTWVAEKQADAEIWRSFFPDFLNNLLTQVKQYGKKVSNGSTKNEQVPDGVMEFEASPYVKNSADRV